MKVYKLTKVQVKPDNELRTDEVIGISENPPTIGQRFTIRGEGLEFGMRLVSTSPVQHVEHDEKTKTYLIRTLNSLYRVEELPAHENPFIQGGTA